MESQPINSLTLMINVPTSLLLCLAVLNGGDAKKEKDHMVGWEGKSQKFLGYMTPPLTAAILLLIPPVPLPFLAFPLLCAWGLSSLVLFEVCASRNDRRERLIYSPKASS